MDTQVVVLMGGLGTRLGLADRPKTMADIDGHPFFDYQFKLLRRWKFYKFLFLVGYQADCIEDYYGDGSRWQVNIQYSYDGPNQLGTGGALKNAEGKLEENFLLIYGDSFMDIDYQETVYRYFMERAAGMSGIMTILRNENRYDSSNVEYREGKLLLYDKVHTNDRMQYIDYGVSMLSRSILADAERNRKFELAELVTALSKKGKLAAQVVSKRFYEIGNPTSLQEFCTYAQKRFRGKRPAIFFDRDGVINELSYNDDIEQLDSPFKPEEFVYKPGVIKTLLSIQRKGYYIFIITNQPAAAKGKTSLARLYDLNTWMMQDLQEKGVSVEFVSMCPHHPTGEKRTGYPFLVKACGCRKPEAGMVTDLMQVYNIDQGSSFLVGDSYTDVITGKKAGLKTVLLGMPKCDACQRLLGNRPDFIIEDMTALEKIIAKWKTGGIENVSGVYRELS